MADAAADAITGVPDAELPEKILLQWHITNRCNYRCNHCYQDNFGGSEPDLASLVEVLSQFKELLSEVGVRRGQRPAKGHVTITGGEPFARSDFPELLEALSANREWASFAILSNGSLIDSSMAHRLKKLGTAFVQVSVEGTATTHDAIRGPGSYEQAVAGLRHLVKAGVRTLISFTAHRQNFREFPDVVRLGRKLGVTRVWADRVIPSGRGELLSDNQLGPAETREFFEIMLRSRKRRLWEVLSRTEVSMGRALQFLVGGGRPYRCEAGRGLITIMPDGTLYPCRRMPIPVGNVTDTPLRELYFNNPLFHSLHSGEKTISGCENCFYARLCRGGLRCLSYAVTGDPFKADPACWRAEEGVNRSPAPCFEQEEYR